MELDRARLASAGANLRLANAVAFNYTPKILA
jgi:hypothetical protein